MTGIVAALGFSLGFCLVRPGSPGGAGMRDWLQAFNWEGGFWYNQITTQGYMYRADAPSNVAFFPAYPLLGRAVMTVTGVRAEAALLIVSNVSFLAALAILAFYVRDRYPGGSGELGDYAILGAALFAPGCFFRLTYSESTFLLLLVLGMYAMLRSWPLCTIAFVVGLGTAARPTGVALLAPFAMHICRRTYIAHQHRRCIPGNSRERGNGQSAFVALSSWRLGLAMRAVRRLAIYLPLACWGIGLFIVYQYREFGEPLAFAKVQKNWGTPVAWREKAISLATLKPIWSVYDVRSRSYWEREDQHRIPWFGLQFANPIFFVSAVALIVVGAFRSLPDSPDGDSLSTSIRKPLGERVMSRRCLSLEETLLGALLLLIPYITRADEMGMGSMGRFTAVVFPMYLVLGQVLVRLPSPLRTAILVLSGCFLAIYTALYAARYAIF